MREFEIEFATVDLPAASNASYNAQPTLTPVWTTIPVSGWLYGWDFQVVAADGESLPREVLHHVKVMSLAHRELFNPIMLHLAGAGGETKPVVLPREVPVVPFFAHVTPPMSDPSYELPPGRPARSLDLKPAVSGEIRGLGGHLHRYGVLLRLEDLTVGEVIWDKEAERSEEGQVLEVPYDRFVSSSLPELRSDHTYRLTAIHDNPTGRTIGGGGMGTLGGAIYVNEPWPKVDRQAAEYAWYLNREATSGDGPRHADH